MINKNLEETFSPHILIYMENTNVSYGRLLSLDPRKLCFPRYQKTEILQVDITLDAQPESAVHFISGLTVEQI